MHADLLACERLVPHVDLARRVVAHDHDREAGREAAGPQPLDANGELGTDVLRDVLAVDDACGHLLVTTRSTATSWGSWGRPSTRKAAGSAATQKGSAPRPARSLWK